jgi:hypothetical protein
MSQDDSECTGDMSKEGRSTSDNESGVQLCNGFLPFESKARYGAGDIRACRIPARIQAAWEEVWTM